MSFSADPTYSVYDENGDYAYNGIANPVAQTVDNTGYRTYTQQQANASIYGTISFMPNLTLKGVFSIRNDMNNEERFKKHYSYGAFDSGLREGFEKYETFNRYTSQVLANYNETWGKHNMAVLAGFEQYEYLYKYTEAARKGGGNDELTESLNTLDAASQTNKDGGRELARQSYFGRLQYNFDSKYLFEANLRMDASSLFPENNRWGTFPSFSAGWVISREEFMQEFTWLSNLTQLSEISPPRVKV